jgi:Tfp pilus assembly protein PilN
MSYLSTTIKYILPIFGIVIVQMKAQLDQQKREVDMLNKTIESLKGEISEQRQLTIEIAQVTQNFKKE